MRMLAFSVMISPVLAASRGTPAYDGRRSRPAQGSSSRLPAADYARRLVAGAGKRKMRRVQGGTLTKLGAEIHEQTANHCCNVKTTRRGFLQAAAGGVAWVALGGSLVGVVSASGCQTSGVTRASASEAPSERAWAFRSRPDLRPPGVRMTTPGRHTAAGHLFCAPKNGPEEAGIGQDGCLILDDGSQPV